MWRSGSEKVRPPGASGRRAGAGTGSVSPGGWRKSAPCSTGTSYRPPAWAGMGASEAGLEKAGSESGRRSVVIPGLPGPALRVEPGRYQR